MKLNTKDTLRFYWQHVKNYKLLVTFLLVALFIAVSIDLIVPYFYKVFFDSLVSGGSREIIADTLIKIIAMVLGLHVVQWIFWRASDFANIYFQVHVMGDIGNKCFEHLHKHSYNFFVSNFTGSLVKRVRWLASVMISWLLVRTRPTQ